MKNLYYYFVRFLARIAVINFYSKIEINGQENIPEDSSNLIFAPNHQSAFLDAVLVAVYSSKPIHFLTRADVFTFPFKYLLYSLNMMPVYRIRDGYKTLSRNEAIFETCKALLQGGKPVLLFPEASQSLVYYLRPLTRGLSRIAYLSQQSFDKPIYIIPVGINYFEQFKSGGKLTLNFGKAINVQEEILGVDNKVLANNKIRDTTSSHLKEVMLIPDDSETYDQQLEFLNANYYDFNFDKLKNKIQAGERAEITSPSVLVRLMTVLLFIPNSIFYLFDFLIVKLFVKDPTFIASISVSLLMFVWPLYLILVLILGSVFFGKLSGVIILAIILISHQIYLRLKSKYL